VRATAAALIVRERALADLGAAQRTAASTDDQRPHSAVACIEGEAGRSKQRGNRNIIQWLDETKIARMSLEEEAAARQKKLAARRRARAQKPSSDSESSD
jgi:hypothetical protein